MGLRGWLRARGGRRVEAKQDKGSTALRFQSSPRADEGWNGAPSRRLLCRPDGAEGRRRTSRVSWLACCIRASPEEEDQSLSSKSTMRELEYLENELIGIQIDFSEGPQRTLTYLEPFLRDEEKKEDWVPRNNWERLEAEKIMKCFNSLENYVSLSMLEMIKFISHLKIILKELGSAEEICGLIMNFIQCDAGGSETKVYEDLLANFLKLVQSVFQRNLVNEFSERLIELLLNMRQLNKNILLKIESGHTLLSYGEQKTAWNFLKITKDWSVNINHKKVESYLEKYLESSESNMDNDPIPSSEDLFILHNKRERKIKRQRNRNTKINILGRFLDTPKEMEEESVRNYEEESADGRFTSFIKATLKTKEQQSKYNSRLYIHTKKKLEFLQGLILYVMKAQECIKREKYKIMNMIDELKNIKETLSQVTVFINTNKGQHPLGVYKEMIGLIKKEMRPLFCFYMMHKDFEKMVSLLKEMGKINYRAVYRSIALTAVFSSVETQAMKSFLEDLMDVLDDLKEQKLSFRMSKETTETLAFSDLDLKDGMVGLKERVPAQMAKPQGTYISEHDHETLKMDLIRRMNRCPAS